jgi:hypothetical protein
MNANMNEYLNYKCTQCATVSFIACIPLDSRVNIGRDVSLKVIFQKSLEKLSEVLEPCVRK